MSDETHQPPAGPDSPVARRVIFAGAALLTLASIAFALQFYRSVGLRLYNEQFLAGMVALALSLVFLTQPMRRRVPRPTVPWFDWVLAGLSIAIGVHLILRYPALSEDMTARPLDGVLVAFVVVAMIMEALRRTVGMALTIIVFVFPRVPELIHGNTKA